ncbi:hypothetical protein GCM10009623_05250 [Nocardioides aestuarii]|uniref:Choice-of-anchor B family protein n=1 Tax=Nocardioides aestuarii TaxID=252231 RepID=A0ABW4TJF3_9ACTN
MRALPALTSAFLLVGVLSSTAPASAHGDDDRNHEVRTELLAAEDTPLISSRVAHLASNPGTLGISGCFMPTAPHFVTSGLESVTVWDVSDPTAPTRAGALANAVFENEAMNCGERRTADGTRRFVLVGIDLYQAAPTDPLHVADSNVGGNELMLVDVTDPGDVHVLARVPATTSTHTVACVEETNCRYAYSAGDSGSGSFSVFDLRDLDHPREVDGDRDEPGIQPYRSPTAGHKWNFDADGIGTHTGFDGSSMWDVDRPRRPRLLATTGRAGKGAAWGFNDFIHHNSFRPNADAFRPGVKPSLAHGNVLLVTEEDYEQTDCALAGSFQTWWVKRLDGGRGGIVPLDKVELADLGNFPLPRGAFCSAHWFDYRAGGIVAAGFYGGGMQLLDVRDPRRIRSYGYAHWFASEVWDAMWVPDYDARGRQTGQDTNVVYSVDLVRGVDVYSVDVPGKVGLEPTGGGVPTGTLGERVAGGAVPAGLVGGALVLTLAVRRRGRRRST